MTPVSGSSLLTAAAYDVAVAKKAQTHTREQGRQALELIQSAIAPAAAPQGALGHLVDVRA